MVSWLRPSRTRIADIATDDPLPAPSTVDRVLDRAGLAASIRSAIGGTALTGRLVSVRIVSSPADAGHDADGELMVRAAEGLIGAAIRDIDDVGRWSADHYVVSLPSASGSAAAEIARRILVASQELAGMAPMLETFRLDVATLALHGGDVDLLDALLDLPHDDASKPAHH